MIIPIHALNLNLSIKKIKNTHANSVFNATLKTDNKIGGIAD